MHQLRPSTLFSPIFSRARKKDWAAEGASEPASTERVLAVREASYPLSLFPPSKAQTLRWFALWRLGLDGTSRRVVRRLDTSEPGI